MAKIETPKTVNDKDFDPKDIKTADEMKATLAKFQEALKGDSFKNLNVSEILGIDSPEVLKEKAEASAKADEEQRNKEAIERLLPAFEKAKEELTAAGYKFKDSDSKMSEGEKLIHERLEKQSIAKFKEQEADVLKIDKDFPVEEISNLPIKTDDKVAVMIANKKILDRHMEATTKVQKELDAVTAELKEVKMSSPAEPVKDSSGADIVKSAMAKFGLEDKSEKDKKSKEKKTE